MLRILATGLALLIVIVVLLPTVILPAMAPDASASRDIARILPDAKRTLSSNLKTPLAYLRYIGMEARGSDRLIILKFEIRPWPYLVADGTYLASRCTPVPELDPADMSTGIGVRDFAADTELAYLRSDAQPPCP
jgi:hypothetical protein